MMFLKDEVTVSIAVGIAGFVYAGVYVFFGICILFVGESIKAQIDTAESTRRTANATKELLAALGKLHGLMENRGGEATQG